jgi:hypothetical protein
MVKLHASLHCSHRALLALDLANIERETSEQAGFIREFGALKRAPLARSERQAEETKLDLSACTPELEEKFRRTATEILEAARLQAALLERAQCKLRVLARMLAGPSVTYGLLLERNGAPCVYGWKPGGEI